MVFSLFNTSKGLLRTLPCYCSTMAFPTLAVPQLLDVPALPSIRLWLPFTSSSQDFLSPPWAQQPLCQGQRLPPACERRCHLLPAPSWGTWLAQLGLKPAQLSSCKENLSVVKSATASGRIIILTCARKFLPFHMFSLREFSIVSQGYYDLIDCRHGARTGFFPCEGTGLVTFPFKESLIPFFPCFHSRIHPAQLDIALIE